MSSLWDRIVAGGDGAELTLETGGRVAVAAVVSALESGQAGDALTGAMGITPRDILGALAFTALGSSEALGPPLNQQRPPRPRLGPALSAKGVAVLLPHAAREAA